MPVSSEDARFPKMRAALPKARVSPPPVPQGRIRFQPWAARRVSPPGLPLTGATPVVSAPTHRGAHPTRGET